MTFPASIATATEVGSPVWWINRLTNRLRQRWARYDRLDKYYRGEHDLPEGDDRCLELYRNFQRLAITNYMPMVADAVRERLTVDGFNAGAKSSDKTNTLAWQAWQANRLDARANQLTSTALVLSDAYAIVGPTPEGEKFPLITVEDPRQVINEVNPANRWDVRAGLKTWCDEVEQYRYAVLYLPDSIHYYRSRDVSLSVNASNQILSPPLARGIGQPVGFTSWEEYEDPIDNEAGSVPVVRFCADPMLDGEGWGEFERLLNIQDRYNFLVLNMMVVVTVQAFRQRYIKGLSTTDPATGEKIDLSRFFPGANILWAVEDENVDFGEFEEVDLTPFITAIERTEAEIVKLAGLPPHYVMGDLVNAAADALAAAEARLVSKVRDRQLEFGEAWEQVMRLVFAYRGQPGLILPDAQVLWRDAERRSIAQLADAAVKARSAGVPWKERMTMLGYSDAEIERMEPEHDVPEIPTQITERVTATADPPPGEDLAQAAPATQPVAA